MSKLKEIGIKAQIFPILIMSVAFPLSMFMWAGNLAWSRLAQDEDSNHIIPPTRWFIAISATLVVTGWGYHRKHLSTSGAFLAIIVGFTITLAHYGFFIMLLFFFISSSKVTKFKGDLKKNFEEEYKDGGQRNWIQVLCNAGMALQLSILYILDSGCGERPLDFSKEYRSTWLAIGVLGALSCSTGDTWSSEIGSVLGGDPILVTSGKRVPRGTNGGVSFPGLLFSILGGLLIGLGFYIALLYTIDPLQLAKSPPQWPIILVGGLGGFLGSLIDSILGATLQFSGVDIKTGQQVAHPGLGVKHISGLEILDNHSINLVSTIILGVLMPKVANMLWF